ncbi:hypothetical protein KEM52_001646, partial [Ascosphaera acerosa]
PTTNNLEIANALPSPDDFRTSLLMSSLSARFSMLKEQDDPTSLLGKANDDSVLTPKRISRLDLFNTSYTGLADIVVSSPQHESSTVYCSQAASASEELLGRLGIMDRPRPAESNSLFAGRQKYYKVPTKKAQLPALADIPTSRTELSPAEQTLQTTPPSPAQPPGEHIRKQHMTAESSLSDSSIASPNPCEAPAVTATAHINQLGLSSPAHDVPPTIPELSSARRACKAPYDTNVSDADDISDLRDFPRPLNLPRRSPSSANSIAYRLTRNATVSCGRKMSPQRAISPTPPTAADGTPLVAALKPEDRGKATALGLFNRPVNRGFNEAEYTRLQRQLHEGRQPSNSPPASRRPSEPLPSPESVMFPASVREQAPPPPTPEPMAQPNGQQRLAVQTPEVVPDSPTLGYADDLLHDSDAASSLSSIPSNRNQAEEPAHDWRNTSPAPAPLLLPPGVGLRTLVRANLRPESEISLLSVNPPSVAQQTAPGNESNSTPTLPLRAPRFEVTEAPDQPEQSESRSEAVSPGCRSPVACDVTEMSAISKEFLERAQALKGQHSRNSSNESGSAQALKGQHSRNSSNESGSSTEGTARAAARSPLPSQPHSPTAPSSPTQNKHMIYRRSRAGSAEFYVEREHLSSELAERRRVLQEKLQKVAMEEEQSKSSRPSTRLAVVPGGFSSILRGRSRPGAASRDSSPNVRHRRLLVGSVSPDGRDCAEAAAQRRPRTPRSRSRSDSDEAKNAKQRAPDNTTLHADVLQGYGSPRSSHSPQASLSSRPSWDSAMVPGPLSIASHPASPRGRPKEPRLVVSPPPMAFFPSPDASAISSPLGRRSPNMSPLAAAGAPALVYDKSGDLSPITVPGTPEGLNGYKRVVKKSEISDPVLISTTNVTPTVDLPLASPPSPPLIPPMSSRRRRTTTMQSRQVAKPATDVPGARSKSRPPQLVKSFTP